MYIYLLRGEYEVINSTISLSFKVKDEYIEAILYKDAF